VQTKQVFMLLPKNSIWFCLIVVFHCCSCINTNEEKIKTKTATAVLVDQFNRYDSLYKLYRKTGDANNLTLAGLTADSVLISTALGQDSFFQKKFFSLLWSRAADLNDLKNFNRSREFFEQYITGYSQYNIQAPEFLAYAQLNLANIYSRYGDYKKAILLLDQSKYYYRKKKEEENLVSCLLNASIALKELRYFNEAGDSLQFILQLNSVGLKRKATACIELADIYIRQHKISDAALQMQKAKEFLIAAPYEADIRDLYAGLYSIEGNFEMAGNDPQKALIAYRLSLDTARKAAAQNLRKREIGKTYIAIGKALEKSQHPDSALLFYNKALYTVIDIDTTNSFALPQQKNIYAENTIAEALYARADCIVSNRMENNGGFENAVSCYQLAFAAESKLLNAFSYDESRLFMVEQTRQQTEKAIAICYQLYKKTNNVRWANEAFLFAEHNKAFVLQESIRRNTAASIFLQQDSAYSKIQEFQTDLALTTIELSKQNFASVKDTAMLRSLNTAKQRIEEALLAAENDLRIKNPQYTDWLNEETALSAGELIDKTIPAGTGMMEYFSGDSSLYVFSAAKNKTLNFYKLSDAAKTISDDLLHFFSNQYLILNNPAAYAKVANDLYQTTLGPYAPKEIKSLLIIPDGFINYIPFDALLTSSSTSGNIASFPFLIKQQQTYFAFSCKTLLAQSQNKKATKANSIAAFAPVFANRERGLSSLTHSNEELEAIKQFYPGGKFFTGNSADFKQFEDNCGNSSILHFATHASPGNDSLPARIELFDSSVYINLLYAKRINAKLVVLSGCETGVGTLNSSEGLMSLARGFSYAGTKNVIASLWQTEDNSSAKIFKDFYSSLSNNNFSTSLHHSKLALLNNGAVATASPYYWAGYIYIGSPEESRPSQSPGKLKWVAVITSLLAITVYFIFRRRRRRY
jgi:CHAT domain-containing protein